MPDHAVGDPGVGELQEERRAAAEQQHALRAVPAEHLELVLVAHPYQSGLPSGPSRTRRRRQYQLTASECAHAAQGEAYLASMYPRPQSICVAALVRQSAPALAILLPGRDWGMP